MKTKVRKTIVLAVLVLTAAMALSACSDGGGQASYDCLVTFNYNTGNMSTVAKDQYLGVKKGGRVIIQPGYSNDFTLYEISGYYVEGWYLAETDSDGNVLDEDGNVFDANAEIESRKKVKLAAKWNFEADTVEKSVTLYANLVKSPSVIYKDGLTGEVVKTDSSRVGEAKSRPSSVVAPKKEGYTLYDYYSDEAMTEKVDWTSFVMTTEDVTVYVKFIEGNWTVVNNERAFNSALANNGKIYLDADLDFSGSTKWVARSFNGTINGNGHKLTGISVSFDGTKTDDSGFGLFTTLRSDANIYDLTIEKAEIKFTAQFNGTYKVGFMAYEAEEGAKFNNVTVGGKITYDGRKSLSTEVNTWIAIDNTNSEDVTDTDYSAVTAEELN